MVSFGDMSVIGVITSGIVKTLIQNTVLDLLDVTPHIGIRVEFDDDYTCIVDFTVMNDS